MTHPPTVPGNVRRHTRAIARSERGAILIAVLGFALIIVTVGLSFMQAGSQEVRNSHQRSASSSAFWLAEAGLQSFMAESWVDSQWPATHTSKSDTLSGGSYAVWWRDTTIAGVDRAYTIVSRGDVSLVGADSERRIRVAAEILPAGFQYVLWSAGDVTFQSTASFDEVDGRVHADGTLSVPPSCDSPDTWNDNNTIKPPPLYTEPDSFGSVLDVTYYYVRYYTAAGKHWAQVQTRFGIDVPGDVWQIKKPGTRYLVDGLTAADLSWTGTRFPLIPGTSSVVVNFGNTGPVDVDFAIGAAPIQTSIINTRYKASAPPTYAGRILPGNWEGGTLTVTNGDQFEPPNGLAIAAHDMDVAGGSGTLIGTPDHPALTYITNDLLSPTGDISVTGTLFALNNITVSGTTNCSYSYDYVNLLPQSMSSSFKTGPSAAINLLKWEEIARQ